MIIAVASDHGGFALKNIIKEHLTERGYKVVDLGTDSQESVDYPVYGKACAEEVAGGRADLGMVFCGTGIGISIAANKVKGVRCALCSDPYCAKMTRLHNDANMLAMGGGILGTNLAMEILDTFLDTPFSGEEKHARRIGKMED